MSQTHGAGPPPPTEAEPRTARGVGAPRCRSCGYDLSGLARAVLCPECGRRPEALPQRSPSVVGGLAIAGACILASLALLLIPAFIQLLAPLPALVATLYAAATLREAARTHQPLPVRAGAWVTCLVAVLLLAYAATAVVRMLR